MRKLKPNTDMSTEVETSLNQEILFLATCD